MTPRRIDPLQRKDDMPDLFHQRQRVLRAAETLQGMATRVPNAGGEPNYAGEKLARAFRANVHAVLVGWRRSDLVDAIDKEAHYVPEAQP
jgi:hypothetical protein